MAVVYNIYNVLYCVNILRISTYRFLDFNKPAFMRLPSVIRGVRIARDSLSDHNG